MGLRLDPRLAGLALIAALALVGCGSSSSDTPKGAQRITLPKPVAPKPLPKSQQQSAPRPSRLKPVPANTAAPLPPPRYRNASFKHCDGDIEVRLPTWDCAFGNNVFYEYFVSGRPSSVRAYSPGTGLMFSVTCSRGVAIVCVSAKGGAVRFPQSAVDAYTQADADRYAATHRVRA